MEKLMKTNGNGHTNGAGATATELDTSEYDQLIVPGLGKLEGTTYPGNDQIEQSVRVILENIGEDPQREGLLRTPSRVAKMYAELTPAIISTPTR